jgi:hypothetical protein
MTFVDFLRSVGKKLIGFSKEVIEPDPKAQADAIIRSFNLDIAKMKSHVAELEEQHIRISYNVQKAVKNISRGKKELEQLVKLKDEAGSSVKAVEVVSQEVVIDKYRDSLAVIEQTGRHLIAEITRITSEKELLEAELSLALVLGDASKVSARLKEIQIGTSDPVALVVSSIKEQAENSIIRDQALTNVAGRLQGPSITSERAAALVEEVKQKALTDN